MPLALRLNEGLGLTRFVPSTDQLLADVALLFIEATGKGMPTQREARLRPQRGATQQLAPVTVVLKAVCAT